MKRILLNLLLLTILSTASIFFLFFTSNINHYQKNGFIRTFKSNPIIKSTYQDLNYNSFYIAGVTEEYLYLGNYTAPLMLLTINRSKNDTQYSKIEPSHGDEVKAGKISVDCSHFFLTDNIQHKIWSGSLSNMKADSLPYKINWLSPITEFNNGSFAMKSLKANKSEVLLTKESLTSIIHNDTLLQKQVDGFFCTDGSLLYSKSMSRLIYVYFYRNQFLVIDSNLNLQYRGNTIDTFTHAHIRVAPIKSEHTLTLAEHPLIVNKKCSSTGNMLFILSDITADNQNRLESRDSSVFDVYDISTNKYKFSFELENWNGNKLTDFVVSNNIIYAIYDQYLIKYYVKPETFVD